MKQLSAGGSAGGAAKGKLLKEKFGFDEVIDYKTVRDAGALSAELKEERLGGKEADWAVLAGERKARQPEVTPEAEPYRHGGAMLQ